MKLFLLLSVKIEVGWRLLLAHSVDTKLFLLLSVKIRVWWRLLLTQLVQRLDGGEAFK